MHWFWRTVNVNKDFLDNNLTMLSLLIRIGAELWPFGSLPMRNRSTNCHSQSQWKSLWPKVSQRTPRRIWHSHKTTHTSSQTTSTWPRPSSTHGWGSTYSLFSKSIINDNLIYWCKENDVFEWSRLKRVHLNVFMQPYFVNILQGEYIWRGNMAYPLSPL